MLRIHFTAQDLARTTIAPEPDPLWEILLSLHMVQSGQGDLVWGRWRTTARDRVPRADLRLLSDLAPPYGYSPDFLTPAGGGPHLGPALERVRLTPLTSVRTDLDELLSRRPATPWTRTLAEGGSGAMQRLGLAMGTYHDVALAPYWTSIRRHVVADQARRVEQLARGGIDNVLANLHPQVHWRAPELQILDFVDTDVHLDGRGLLLQPSFFCWQAPTKLHDVGPAPVLVYPTHPAPGVLDHDGNVGGDGRRGQAPLAALIGRTRATALEAVVAGCTTSELAQFCGVSIAAASQQATVLRDAALITTRRDGTSVRHEITALGLSLLDGHPVPGSF